ncbi:hypothetical protein AeNC1_011128 [Aphanomyces euteiches]|nr:hypothetical protein AeNC1_011128 [Aphanomyces euteiches]
MTKNGVTAADSPMDKADRARLKKREYIRTMMRIYRQEMKDEMADLRQKIPELEAELQRLQIRKRRRAQHTPESQLAAADEDDSSTALSWKDVDMGLLEANEASASDATFLQGRIQNLQHIFKEMKRWVSAQQPIARAPQYPTSTWQNVTLFSNPSTRFLGKEWITEQLYHNAEAMFRRYRFPPIESDEGMQYIDVEFEDNCAHFVLCRQFEEDLPREKITELYRHHLCSILMVDGPYDIPPNTITEISGKTFLHQMITHRDECISLLSGEFYEPDRCVFVAQQILDDELIGPPRRQRNRTWWTELQRVSSGVWRRRILYRFSQSFTPEGYVPFHVEALDWGVELDASKAAEVNQRIFRQAVLPQTTVLYERSDERYIERTTAPSSPTPSQQ